MSIYLARSIVRPPIIEKDWYDELEDDPFPLTIEGYQAIPTLAQLRYVEREWYYAETHRWGELAKQTQLQIWAKQVKDRDGWICQTCGNKSRLQAHHIKPKSEYPGMALDIDNGITLCRACHNDAHGKKTHSPL